MGYRNYFYIADKGKTAKFLSLSHKEQMEITTEIERSQWTNPKTADESVEEYLERDELSTNHVIKYLNAEEIIECGKYFDLDTANKIKEDCIDLSDDDCELCFVKPEALLVCTEYYRNCAVKYFKGIVKSFDMTDEECSKDPDLDYHRPDLKSLFHHITYDLQKLDVNEMKDSKLLMNTWQYDYDLFNMLHIYKSLDWNKYQLIWTGY